MVADERESSNDEYPMDTVTADGGHSRQSRRISLDASDTSFTGSRTGQCIMSVAVLPAH